MHVEKCRFQLAGAGSVQAGCRRRINGVALHRRGRSARRRGHCASAPAPSLLRQAAQQAGLLDADDAPAATV